MRGLFLCLLLSSSLASADGGGHTARAKVLYGEGMKQYNLARFSDALASFEQAYLASPDPVFLFNIGQCHRMLGHQQEAIYSYRRFLSASPDTPNRAEVEGFIASAEAALQRKEASAPPTGTLPPKEEPKEEPAPAAQPASVPPPATNPAAPPAASSDSTAPSASPTLPATNVIAKPAPSRRWIWGIIGAVAAVVVIGAAIAVAVAVSGPSVPAHPGDTLGSTMVTF
jgi:hypothetical protein